MFLASTFFRTFRPVLSASLAAVALAVVPGLPTARGITLQTPYALPTNHIKYAPYDFLGRVFDLDFIAFGSGSLLRRHTVLTAGHVVYDPTLGFTANTSFTRALYEDYQLSASQVIAVEALSGYQADVLSSKGNANLTAFRNDQGLLVLHDAPVDDNWATYVTTPSLLSSSASKFFVLGYPGVTFDGLTPAYIVPMSPYVASGTDTGTGEYENNNYLAEEGMSGGPVFVVPDGVHQYIAASTVGGVADTSGEFTQSFVRAITPASGTFIADAEYTTGLIKKVRIKGPTTVSRGQTYTYTANIVFAVAAPDGSKTTDRYSELQLQSNTPGTTTLPLVSVTKTSNTTFNVTFSSNIHTGAQTTLQIYYDGTSTPLGKSSKIIKVQ